MTRSRRPERNRTARSFRQLRRFHHVINSHKVFGTHRFSFVHMGAPSNRTATLESQMIPMIQDVPGQTLSSTAPQSAGGSRAVGVHFHLLLQGRLRRGVAVLLSCTVWAGASLLSVSPAR